MIFIRLACEKCRMYIDIYIDTPSELEQTIQARLAGYVRWQKGYVGRWKNRIAGPVLCPSCNPNDPARRRAEVLLEECSAEELAPNA